VEAFDGAPSSTIAGVSGGVIQSAVDDSGNGDSLWFLLVKASPASGGCRGGTGTPGCKKGGWFSTVAGVPESTTSGGLRGVPGFSERRRDNASEVPSCVISSASRVKALYS
jgi:hypothetical protein